MAKPAVAYICEACGASFPKWSGRCLNCGAWDSLTEAITKIDSKKRSAKAFQPARLSTLKADTLTRISTGFRELDNVLGSGIVPGSLVLLSGDPGIGKSTIVLQIAERLARRRAVLYVSGEESAAQIKLRASRLDTPNLDFDLAATTDIDSILTLCSTHHYDLVIIDSIQTMHSDTLDSAAGTISQITHNTNQISQIAKSTDTAFIIIGHVTKEGNVAGPKLLEHLVDTVIYIEGETSGHFKIVRSVKNRFGSVSEVGIWEMTSSGLKEVANPSAHLLAEKQDLPGSIVYGAMEGTRALLVEVQALVSTTIFGYPKRTAAGVDLNRLQLLTAVMTKRGGINLSNQDIYVNIVGGLKILEPAIDLAIILAIASAYKNISPPDGTVVFGEVGLSGEIRSVASAERRLSEAKKLGFTRAIAPANSHSSAQYQPTNITQAIVALDVK